MEEEAPNSAGEVNTPDQNPNSVEATIESGADFTAVESTCNTANVEKSVANSDGEGVKSLEIADQLMARGSAAAKESDYVEATDCFSRALEIRWGFVRFTHSV